jgi:hypothetical protein
MVRSLPHIYSQFWIRFQEYLMKVYPEYTARVRLSYTRKYFFILPEGNAQELLTLSHDDLNIEETAIFPQSQKLFMNNA